MGRSSGDQGWARLKPGSVSGRPAGVARLQICRQIHWQPSTAFPRLLAGCWMKSRTAGTRAGTAPLWDAGLPAHAVQAMPWVCVNECVCL